MPEDKHKSEGSFLIAQDLAERLLPNLPMSELLLWPPDLFAYTSYVLSVTGAYQLVISPPTNKCWPPKNEEVKDWLSPDNAILNLQKWYEAISISVEWQIEPEVNRYFTNQYQKEFVKGLDLEVSCKVFQDGQPIVEDGKPKEEKVKLQELLDRTDRSYWKEIVVAAGRSWSKEIGTIEKNDFDLIDENEKNEENRNIDREKRSSKLFHLVLVKTPPLVLACWLYFYNKTVLEPNPYCSHTILEWRQKMPIESLLCNETDRTNGYSLTDLWPTAQALLTMNAICDETCVNWGILAIRNGENRNPLPNSDLFAQNHLLDRGTLSTINPERCRVLPKRHNPSIGITLRSLSSNLAFHRSSVDVVWRNCAKNDLTEKLMLPRNKDGSLSVSGSDTEKPTISMLLLPLPIHIQTKDFRKSDINRVDMDERDFGFFSYLPEPEQEIKPEYIKRLVEKAIQDLAYGNKSIDIIVLPESAIKDSDVTELENELQTLGDKTPSIYVTGVREYHEKEKSDDLERFPRNAVYCKYFNDTKSEKWGTISEFEESKKKGWAPKYIQYKHHRWLLNSNQIKQYGLSQALDTRTNWWEAIKVPRRRVSFLNIGERMTLCHLICEDLARQDPIADLIRQVGPSLVITILLDGPQRADRWASRYATVLSEDPGCSVITLTSFGMVRRWSSAYRSMSRVIALWSDKTAYCREIELAQGAEAVLLNIEVDTEREITADGRKESERHTTSVFKLVDVIQVYPGRNPP